MKKHFKLGIIGCGAMAQTILKGVVLSDFLHEKKIIVSDSSEDKLAEVDFLGVRTTSDNRVVAENSEFLLLAIEPHKFDETVKRLNGF